MAAAADRRRRERRGSAGGGGGGEGGIGTRKREEKEGEVEAEFELGKPVMRAEGYKYPRLRKAGKKEGREGGGERFDEGLEPFEERGGV